MFDMLMKTGQFFVTIIVGMYFFNQLVTSKSDADKISKDSVTEAERIHNMRRHGLTKPLTEQTRPASIAEIVGQEEGVKALKIALGGKNPQHVIIYGPAGVGKTAAARVVLEYVKKTKDTPFKANAPFIEIDATTLHYDERAVADPLMGSVHDPIYQGAGAYGNAGIPQIKEGAVSRAHGGVLFIDEIGELSSQHINRLLKVLEDGKVTYESAYYSKGDKQIPRHIKDVFENGMPADFRLVGATTRPPEKIPEAIRSRCVEIYFEPLTSSQVQAIIINAANKLQIKIPPELVCEMSKHLHNGRNSVKMTQMLASKLDFEDKQVADMMDVAWILKTSKIS